jgi:uncharacterized protein
MAGRLEAQSTSELRRRLGPFCEKHHIRRLEVFGSAARGQTGPGSDVDLLVTLDESVPISTSALLEMAGEAEELIGAPVDFVLRPSLEKSPNRFARDHILSPLPSACMEADSRLCQRRSQDHLGGRHGARARNLLCPGEVFRSPGEPVNPARGEPVRDVVTGG